MWLDLDCFGLALGALWCIVNTVLLVFCWIPPILRLQIKLIVSAGYAVVAAALLFNWPRIIQEVADALGQGGLVDAVPLGRWVLCFRFLAESGFIGLALVVLASVMLDMSRHHHNRDLDDLDGPEYGG